MNRAAAWLLDLLYPNRCDCCGEPITYDRDICAACAEALEALRCPYEKWAENQTKLLWDGGMTVYAYSGAAKEGVLALKDGYRGFCRYAARALADEVRRAGVQPDCVTWVPMAKRRKRQQGYAHAELLGREIARNLGIPARGDLLTEPDGRIRQHELPAAERKKYAKRFERTAQQLHGETVLLADDILTTGSTLRACTALLRESGAERVYIAAACCGVNGRK